VPGLPRQPRDPQGEGSRVEGRPGAGRRDVWQVPHGDLRPVQGVDPRGGAREGDRGSALLHRVPRGAQDLLPERPQVDGLRDPRVGAVLQVPRLRQDHGKVRHRDGAGGHLQGVVPRRGEPVRLPHGGELLLLPRGARHPAAGRSALDGEPEERAEDVREVPSRRQPELRGGKIHVDAKNKESGIIYWTATFFKWLTIGTMLALIAHIFLDMYGRTKRLRGER